MARTFRVDEAGLNEISRSPAVRAALAAVAEKGKAIAIGLASDFVVTGDYISSFEVQETTVDWHGRYPGRRAAANLTNTSDHAAAVEWGNAHDPKAHHVLERTAEALEHG